MGQENALRSAMPEDLRAEIAKHAGRQLSGCLPDACKLVVQLAEWRLAVEPDLADDSPEAVRLQRLRLALLEYLSRPLEGIA
jgi:hypothetical protein